MEIGYIKADDEFETLIRELGGVGLKEIPGSQRLFRKAEWYHAAIEHLYIIVMYIMARLFRIRKNAVGRRNIARGDKGYGSWMGISEMYMSAEWKYTPLMRTDFLELRSDWNIAWLDSDWLQTSSSRIIPRRPDYDSCGCNDSF